MTAAWVSGIVAMAAGAAIAVQSSLSGMLGTRIGILGSSFVVHAAGLLLAAALVGLAAPSTPFSWRAIPWYAVPAGFLGVGIVAAVSYAVPRLGLSVSLTLTVVAQLALGAVLDHFGWLGAPCHALDAGRIVGILAIAVGTWLIVR